MTEKVKASLRGSGYRVETGNRQLLGRCYLLPFSAVLKMPEKLGGDYFGPQFMACRLTPGLYRRGLLAVQG
ncbi:MAG: hypothetical protein ACYC2T_14925 [Bacillota bacterium]